MAPLRAIALDPGITTGIAILTDIPAASRTGFRYTDLCNGTLHLAQEKLSVYELYSALEQWRPYQIICENFEYRNRAREKLELFSVQLIGVTNLYVQRMADCDVKVELVLQTAATGKGHYSDAKIRGLDLWVPGKPHAMDATRHLLHWLTFGSGYRFKDKANELGIGIV